MLHLSNHICSYKTFQTLVNSTSTDLDAPYQLQASSFTSATSQATARRLRRMRQRLGGYRHDLLVAMRVVNGVELEMVQAEWEAWLEGENWRCEQVRGMLSEGEGNGVDGGEKPMGASEGEQKVMGEGDDNKKDGDGARKAALREWFAEYCGSCDADRRALATRRGSML